MWPWVRGCVGAGICVVHSRWLWLAGAYKVDACDVSVLDWVLFRGLGRGKWMRGCGCVVGWSAAYGSGVWVVDVWELDR